jgi:hypothetical protein
VAFEPGTHPEYDPTVRAFGSDIVRFMLDRTEDGTGAFAFAADGRAPDCNCPEFCELDHANE